MEPSKGGPADQPDQARASNAASGRDVGAGASGDPSPADSPRGTGDEGSYELDPIVAERIDALEAALVEANAKYQRALADYHNYHRRALQNEVVARQQGAASVVKGVVGIIDHFDVALAQDLTKTSSEHVVAGVRLIREELMKALQAQGVRMIQPQANDEFEPGRHEAVMQQPAPDVEPGRVVSTFQTGYLLGEQVLRPAKVAVAPAE